MYLPATNSRSKAAAFRSLSTIYVYVCAHVLHCCRCCENQLRDNRGNDFNAWRRYSCHHSRSTAAIDIRRPSIVVVVAGQLTLSLFVHLYFIVIANVAIAWLRLSLSSALCTWNVVLFFVLWQTAIFSTQLVLFLLLLLWLSARFVGCCIGYMSMCVCVSEWCCTALLVSALLQQNLLGCHNSYRSSSLHTVANINIATYIFLLLSDGSVACDTRIYKIFVECWLDHRFF